MHKKLFSAVLWSKAVVNMMMIHAPHLKFDNPLQRFSWSGRSDTDESWLCNNG